MILSYSTVNRTINNMTNISKQQLPEKEFEKLFIKFSNLFRSSSQQLTSNLFDDLLGTEEKIMLVKRLAAVVMYIEDNSSYRVWKSLHLSPSTAEKIRLDFDRGRYKHIEQIFKAKKESYKDFWLTLDVILRAGTPPRGKGRWKSVLNNLNK